MDVLFVMRLDVCKDEDERKALVHELGVGPKLSLREQRALPERLQSEPVPSWFVGG